MCGEFVGRKISGLFSPEDWAILLVTMHEVQQRKMSAQLVYQAMHLLPPGLLVQGLCSRDQCPVSQVVMELGVPFPLPLIGETRHVEHRPTGEKEIVLQVFGAQLILHPLPSAGVGLGTH